MHTELKKIGTRKVAGDLQPGDQVMANDGALLEVEHVRSDTFGYRKIIVTFKPDGPLGMSVMRCRDSKVVRVLELEGR